jgi:hypothetical protein
MDHDKHDDLDRRLADAWTKSGYKATSTSPTHHGENRKYKEPASLKLNAKPRSRFLPRSRLLLRRAALLAAVTDTISNWALISTSARTAGTGFFEDRETTHE